MSLYKQAFIKRAGIWDSIWGGVKNIASNEWNRTKDTLSNWGSGLANTGRNFVNTAKGVYNGVTDNMAEAATGIQRGLNRAGDYVRYGTRGVAQRDANAERARQAAVNRYGADNVKQDGPTRGPGVFEAIGQGAKNQVGIYNDTLQNYNNIQNRADQANREALANAAVGVGMGVVDNAKAVGNAVVNGARAVGNAASGAYDSATDAMASGMNRASELINYGTVGSQIRQANADRAQSLGASRFGNTPAPANPVAPAPQSANPVAPAPQPANPVAPAPQPANPVAPAPQPANPVAPAPQPANPAAPAPAPANPVASASQPAPSQTSSSKLPHWVNPGETLEQARRRIEKQRRINNGRRW